MLTKIIGTIKKGENLTVGKMFGFFSACNFAFPVNGKRQFHGKSKDQDLTQNWDPIFVCMQENLGFSTGLRRSWYLTSATRPFAR